MTSYLTPVTYGSVCSGIEAASVAWKSLKWKVEWFSEIEKFPCAVLQHHWPNVPNLGDMTRIAGRIRDGEIAAPTVLVGGTPCQAFSVSGTLHYLPTSQGHQQV
ncbi:MULTISPECIES: DNA cytosine methyltransferase [Citrobacter]|uniref:DNA cytosine methyltransferase n=1 Tax=Citrobacter braakii TaxID=57706 RepID=A0ABR6TR49_CITBR|nr:MULTISPECIES: DNA cytosine methyltransferase [Citrobacter]MBC2609263.1 DNA cytosine methyltransferase [Citrobacter braakii]MBC2633303.1 DNA cytosine methyltransferase [Citrobacter braakii]MBC2646022.1 DNA cytosine methyltransferase [Citrobacter braakii]MDM3430888.1 DNA cytosine methyltransferase [Citrobacter sp. Cb023]MDM3434963.1 DNA cytosine methyltransferase [Citrobacter sp. Cb034]